MREQWVEEIMQSIDNLKPVEISESLNAAILQQIPVPQQFSPLSKSAKWMLAACILLLVGLNGISILHYTNIQDKASNIGTENPIYTEYFSPFIQE